MGIVYQTDKRSGITYAYENQSFWDPELKRSRSKRKLIGRVDKDTGEIVLLTAGAKSAALPTRAKKMADTRCLKP